MTGNVIEISALNVHCTHIATDNPAPLALVGSSSEERMLGIGPRDSTKNIPYSERDAMAMCALQVTLEGRERAAARPSSDALRAGSM